MRKRITIGIALLLLSILLSFFYRPFIYSNELNDFYLADTVNNFLAVFTAYFILPFIVKSKTSQFSLIIQITVGFICYEIIQKITGFGTFDLKDIFTTCLAGLILFLFALIRRDKLKYSNNKSTLSQK